MIYVLDHRRSAVVELATFDAATLWRRLPLPAAVGGLSGPMGLSLAGDGRLLVADSGKARMVVLDPEGAATTILDPAGSLVGALRGPRAACIAPDGSLIVADTGNHRLVRASALVSPQWTEYGTPGLVSPNGFVAPTGVYVDPVGHIFVADPAAGRLIRVDDFNGTGWTEIALPVAPRAARPCAVARGVAGGLVVADQANSRVLLFAADGSIVAAVDGASDRSLIAPVAIAMTAADLVVADAAAARLGRWSLDPGTARWTLRQSLVGVPGPAGGPEFSGLCGLCIKEAI